MATIKQLSKSLEEDRQTSRSLVEECLERTQDRDGEGVRVFLQVHSETARAAADVMDRARKAGCQPSPYAGIPISIKDLFDIAGDVTGAGSKVFVDHPAASTDAKAVARLKSAGFIVIGRTNMTEFAYSGLGINPHFGTPLNPYDRKTGRIPGGSTSGGAVSVADGMAFATLGTDTGGSCRIPAAFCGIVGLKTTAGRIPREGVVPLSHSLDSVGPLANSVNCCAILDSILDGGGGEDVTPFPIEGLRLGAPQSYVLDNLDDHVATAYARVLTRLSKAGAKIIDIPLTELLEIPQININGGIVGMEAFAWHRPLIEKYAGRYDPWILARFELPKNQRAADYIDLIRDRRDLIERIHTVSRAFDALVMPTVPTIPPTLAELESPEISLKNNILVLRNTMVGNFLDRCAISLPCHGEGDAPVGFMVVGERDEDRHLLSIAAGIEPIVTQDRSEP